LAAAGPGPSIGLAWTGGLPGTLRSARSLSLEHLASLVRGFAATYVALEFLDCSAEVEAFNRQPGARIAWWPQAVSSIDETAALVAALDLVISVTTATAHLAAALGRPTWVLVPSVPSWRYLWQGEEMPWYPSMRVLRGGGSREAVVAAALQRLNESLLRQDAR
jgi:ADP-heptose:LPS heptosyltransferase